MTQVFILGMVMGFFACVFPGPINLETLRRAIGSGPKVGAAFGFGAVTGDVLLAGAAALGATSFWYTLPPTGRGLFGLFSTLIIVYVGISALQAKVKPPAPVPLDPNDPAYDKAHREKHGIGQLIRNYVMGLLITIWSPSTIAFWFIASFQAAKHMSDDEGFIGPMAAVMISAGVGTMCSIWVIGAVTIAGRYHRNLAPKTYLRIERVVGVALLVIAAVSFVKTIGYFTGHAPAAPSSDKIPKVRWGKRPAGATTATLQARQARAAAAATSGTERLTTAATSLP